MSDFLKNLPPAVTPSQAMQAFTDADLNEISQSITKINDSLSAGYGQSVTIHPGRFPSAQAKKDVVINYFRAAGWDVKEIEEFACYYYRFSPRAYMD